VLNVCLICSALLIVKVTLVITVFFLITVCVSTIFVNKDDKKTDVIELYRQCRTLHTCCCDLFRRGRQTVAASFCEQWLAMRRVTLTLYYVLSQMNLAVTHVALMTCTSLVYSNLSICGGLLSVCLSVCSYCKLSNCGFHFISADCENRDFRTSVLQNSQSPALLLLLLIISCLLHITVTKATGYIKREKIRMHDYAKIQYTLKYKKYVYTIQIEM